MRSNQVEVMQQLATGLLKREVNLSWLVWVQQDRGIFCLLIYQSFNNREVRKLLKLICTLRAWEKRVWLDVGYRLEEAVGTTNRTKVKMELDCVEGIPGHGGGTHHELDMTTQETPSRFTLTWFNLCTNIIQIAITVVRMPSMHGSLLCPELCFGCTGILEVQLGLDTHLLKTGNGRVKTAPFVTPVFSFICFLVVLNLNDFPHPLAPAIFGSSRRWNQISHWCKAR